MQAIMFPTSSPAPASSAGRAPAGKSDGPSFIDVLTGVTGLDKAPGGDSAETAPAEETDSTETVEEGAPVEGEVPGETPVEAEDAAEVAAAVAGIVLGVTTPDPSAPATTSDAAVISEVTDAALSGIAATTVDAASAEDKAGATTTAAAPTPTTDTADAEGVTTPAIPTTVVPATAAKTANPVATPAPPPDEAVPVAPVAEAAPPVESKTPVTTTPAPATTTDALRNDPIALAMSAAAVKSTAKPADLSVGMRRFQIAEAKAASAEAETAKESEAMDAAEAGEPLESARPLSSVAKATPAQPTSTTGGVPLADAPVGVSPAAPVTSAAPDGSGTQGVGLAAGASPSPPATAEAVAATAASQASAPETPDVHGVSEQALRHLRLLAHAEGGQTIRVRLVPETLGELHLEVHRQGDTITVRMASANPAVRDALESQAQQIQQTLQKDGVQHVRVEISQGLNTNADAGGRAQEQAQHARAQQTARGYAPPGGSTQSAVNTQVQRTAQHTGNLNLFI